MNTVIGWMFGILVAAAAVWLLLVWWSLRRHTARRAAPAAAPATAPPAPAAARVVLPPAPAATTAPTPATAPTAAATAPPVTGPVPPLPKEPFLRKWFLRLVVLMVATVVISAIVWLFCYAVEHTSDAGKGLWTALKSLPAWVFWTIMGLVVGGLIGWLVYKWWNRRSTTTAPATSTTVAAGATTAAGATGAPATPSAADLKAAKETEFRQRVEERKLSMQLWATRRRYAFRFVAFVALIGCIWAFGFWKQANGLTPSQEFVASAGKSEPQISYTCITWPPGSLGTPPAQRAWVIQGQWGQRDHLWFNVECFVQGRSVVTLYRWDGRQKAGTWECEAKRERSTFTGDFDPTDPNRFSGEIEFNGQQYRYVLNRRIASQ